MILLASIVVFLPHGITLLGAHRVTTLPHLVTMAAHLFPSQVAFFVR